MLPDPFVEPEKGLKCGQNGGGETQQTGGNLPFFTGRLVDSGEDSAADHSPQCYSWNA